MMAKTQPASAQERPSTKTGRRKRRDSGSIPRASAPKGRPQAVWKLSMLVHPPEKTPMRPSRQAMAAVPGPRVLAVLFRAAVTGRMAMIPVATAPAAMSRSARRKMFINSP